MHTTRLSLIQKLAHGETESWEEVDRIYRTLIRGWLRRYSLSSEDADDITQEVLAVLLRDIKNFEHNGRVGAFRNWLRTTTVNLTRNYLRKKNRQQGTGSSAVREMLAQLEDPESSLSREFNTEHDQHVVQMLLERLSKQFEPITLQIFQMHVVDGIAAKETAERLNVSIASVHTAKSRVLRRLRQDARDSIDEVYL